MSKLITIYEWGVATQEEKKEIRLAAVRQNLTMFEGFSNMPLSVGMFQAQEGSREDP